MTSVIHCQPGSAAVRCTNNVTVVAGGWTENNAQDVADPLPFTGNSGCAVPVRSEDPLELFEQFVTADFVSDRDTTYTSINQEVSTSKKM